MQRGLVVEMLFVHQRRFVPTYVEVVVRGNRVLPRIGAPHGVGQAEIRRARVIVVEAELEGKLPDGGVGQYRFAERVRRVKAHVAITITALAHDLRHIAHVTRRARVARLHRAVRLRADLTGDVPGGFAGRLERVQLHDGAYRLRPVAKHVAALDHVQALDAFDDWRVV